MLARVSECEPCGANCASLPFGAVCDYLTHSGRPFRLSFRHDRQLNITKVIRSRIDQVPCPIVVSWIIGMPRAVTEPIEGLNVYTDAVTFSDTCGVRNNLDLDGHDLTLL